MSEKVAKGEYEFSVTGEQGNKSTCHCSCNASNPVQVTFSAASREGQEAEVFSIGPENVKKLSL